MVQRRASFRQKQYARFPLAFVPPDQFYEVPSDSDDPVRSVSFWRNQLAFTPRLTYKNTAALEINIFDVESVQLASSHSSARSHHKKQAIDSLRIGYDLLDVLICWAVNLMLWPSIGGVANFAPELFPDDRLKRLYKMPQRRPRWSSAILKANRADPLVNDGARDFLNWHCSESRNEVAGHASEARDETTSYSGGGFLQATGLRAS